MGGEWFRRYGTDAVGAPLMYCFPHAGGAASAYIPLSRALSPAVEVWSVQYPGRQERRREEPVRDLGELAALIADQVQREAGRPYAFFGHSMGAVVAFEAARLLAGRKAQGPVHLFVSGRSAPSAGPRRSDLLKGDSELRAEMRRLGGTAGRVLDDPELMDMVMPALRADYQALSGYRWAPGQPLDCPITVLVGDSDPVVTLDEAAAWGQLTTRPAVMRAFPGGHFYLDDHIGEVAGAVAAGLGLEPPVAAAR
ncbi:MULTISPECIES: thioesterase II family protein [unclassified Streptomyces]|uniref:thioesterase II family protein n=1 Tax=unclassified Streptomyces TaxID=2593676 RepID=UPI00380897A7